MFFSWILLLLEGLISFILKNEVSENNDFLCTIVIAINAISVIITILMDKKSDQNMLIILGGYVFRMLLMIWDLKFRSVFMLPNSGQDTETFALGARSGYLLGDFGRSGIYGKCIAACYEFFGVQRPIAQYMNVLLTMTLLYLLIKIMDRLKTDNETQQIVVMLLCFLPNFAITNSILLRETVIIYLVTISVYFFIKWIESPQMLTLILSIIAGSLGALFHSGAIAILLGEAIVYVLIDKEKKLIRINKNSIFSIAFVVIAFIVLQSAFGDSLFGKFSGIDSADDIVSKADSYNAGNSAYDAGFEFNNSIVSLIINTPIRMFYFIASPLPWNWRGLSDIIAFLFNSMVFLYIYIYAFKELKRGNNTNKTMIIIFVILSLSSAMVFAWGVSNAGTAVRHREKFITIYMLLYAVSRSGHRELEQEGEENKTNLFFFRRHHEERRN